MSDKKKTNAFGGKRDLTITVKTARGRKNSSTRWLQRQLNDPYVTQAKVDGYRSRAAYKIIEIDDKFNFLKKGKIVVDLGAAPGGWTQVAIERMNILNNKTDDIIAVDILEMTPIAGSTALCLDFTQDEAPEIIKNTLNGKKADIVMSDLAPNTTGHSNTDHLRIMGMCEMAYEFAKDILAPEGIFICKVRQGGTEGDLLINMKKNFKKVAHFKPVSSRKDSSETYVVAIGFRDC